MLHGTTLAWWIIGYGFVASVLPVWLLLAPRDYLSTFVKIGAVLALGIAIVVLAPPLQMPALTRFIDGSGPVFAGPVFPFCFITIACAAISGFEDCRSCAAGLHQFSSSYGAPHGRGRRCRADGDLEDAVAEPLDQCSDDGSVPGAGGHGRRAQRARLATDQKNSAVGDVGGGRLRAIQTGAGSDARMCRVRPSSQCIVTTGNMISLSHTSRSSRWRNARTGTSAGELVEVSFSASPTESAAQLQCKSDR
jgi:hypothetical protein